MMNLIVNPMAKRGKGLQLVETAKLHLNKAGIEYKIHMTEFPKHATEIAYNLVMEGADTIVSCGGDGTINEVINGIIKAKNKLAECGKTSNVKLGLLPCGTGNDFIRSASMETDIIKATELLINGKAKPADAINVGGHYEICFACQGIDAEVVNMVNASRRKTKLSYLKKLLKCIFKNYAYDFVITADTEKIEKRGIIVAVLNGGKIASGMKFCPTAKIDDGLFDVIIVEQVSIVKSLSALIAIYKGNLLEKPFVIHRQCKSCEIISQQPIIDIDGELFDNLEFKAEIVPNILSIIR